MAELLELGKEGSADFIGVVGAEDVVDSHSSRRLPPPGKSANEQFVEYTRYLSTFPHLTAGNTWRAL